MKTYLLVYLIASVLLMQLLFTCSNNSHKKSDPKLIGIWTSKKDNSKLKITDKQFTMESDAPDPEDYFVKGDTIFTSFEGNLPYTKYAILKLDDHYLKLFTPDSTTVEFSK